MIEKSETRLKLSALAMINYIEDLRLIIKQVDDIVPIIYF